MTDFLFGPMLDGTNTLGAGGNITVGNISILSTLSVNNLAPSGNLLLGGFATVAGAVTFSSNATVGGQLAVAGNARVTGNVFAQNFFFSDGSSLNSDVYDLDDVSNYADGIRTAFALSYNKTALTLLNPFRVLVTVNGVTQPGFIRNADTVWFSMLLSANRGYTADSSGNLKFADPPPVGSLITARTQTGSTRSTTRVYPFNASDVMMGI